MERMMESVAVEDLEVDRELDLSAAENIGNEPALYEKFLLDDLDNYWDEINDRLTVSRMVSDSVIKGMVHAVVEESAEKIASKEAEIAVLNENLQLYESKAATGTEFIKLPLEHGYFGATGDSGNLDSLKVAVEEQLQMLKDDIGNARISSCHGRVNTRTDFRLCNGLPKERTSEQLVEIDARVDAIGAVVSAVFDEIKGMFTSLKASMLEEQLECKFQREINSVIVQSCVTGLQAEFEKKLYEQRNLIHMLTINWQQKVTELSTMREELDSMSRSILNNESSPLISYNSHESFEEGSTVKQNDKLPRTISGHSQLPSTAHAEENGSSTVKKSKDIAQPLLEVADASHLKHMSNEELASYFKTELLKMKRQHESALQEKTEEIFRLKRKFLKEKGSPFRKDKDIELLRKKLPEVIVKLDHILLTETLPRIETNYDDLCRLKGKINALLSDNQHLQGLLAEKGKEVRSLLSQISDAESQMSFHSSAETKYWTQIKELEGNLEDMKVETSIGYQLLNVIYKEVIGEYMFGREDIDIETKLVQEIYITVTREVVGDVMSSAHSIISKYYTEKSSVEALLSDKQKLLYTEIEDDRKLKEAMLSISTLMKEKENFASETDSKLMQQKQQFDLLNEELGMLREQVSKQWMLISENKMESQLLQRRLDKSLQQINQNELEINRLKEELVIASDGLKEAEKQKTMLQNIAEDKEKKLSSSNRKENQEAKQMHSTIVSLMNLSKAFVAFESKLTKKIEKYETRLKNLSHEFISLFQWANQLTKKQVWYKKMLDIRYSNLLKAEAEVDLLGDEVDALSSLLGKIYIALDHYSPVLLLYPGIMEILKLVKRELEGETTLAS